MEIHPYQPSSHAQAELVDLINYCQNLEAHLDIKMAEQADIFDIPHTYQASGGNFWVASENHRIVGSIALLPLDHQTAVLKKFFTYPAFRGRPIHLGAQLYTHLLTFAQTHGYHRIVLDTPEQEARSHTFYEHHHFHRISPAQLKVQYAYPDRHSRLYELRLN